MMAYSQAKCSNCDHKAVTVTVMSNWHTASDDFKLCLCAM